MKSNRSAHPFLLLVILLAVPAPRAQTPAPARLQAVSTRALGPGITYRHYAAAPDARFAFYRVIGRSQGKREDVAALLTAALFLPVPLEIEALESGYRWRSDRLDSESLAQLLVSHLRFQGLADAQAAYEGIEDLRAAGPLCLHVLELDPAAVLVRSVRALDAAIGLETVSSISRRQGAIAAVNGGYFRTTGAYRGESDGAFRWGGKWISEPRPGRSAIGLLSDGGGEKILFGKLALRSTVRLGTEELPIDGINRPRDKEGLILYSPEMHRSTLTAPGGVEVRVSRGRVIEILERAGNSLIPPDGYVLSGAGKAGERLRQAARRHRKAEIRHQPSTPEGHPEVAWGACENILGGGPRLIAQGRDISSSEPEKANAGFFDRRHPRTALGIRPDGTVLLVVIDGRQSQDSLGLTIPQLAALMLEFGCTEAINLDGGGSSTMVLEDRIVNHPSDATGERPDSDALLVFPRAQRK